MRKFPFIICVIIFFNFQFDVEAQISDLNIELQLNDQGSCFIVGELILELENENDPAYELPYNITFVHNQTGDEFYYIMDESVFIINPLSSGTYEIEIDFNEECTQFYEFEVPISDSQPQINVIDVISQGTCGGQYCNGEIYIEVTPPNNNYEYQWVKEGAIVSNSQNLIGFCEGEYTLTVILDENCMVSQTMTLCCCIPFQIGNPISLSDLGNTTQFYCGNIFDFPDGPIANVINASDENSMDGSIDYIGPESDMIGFQWYFNGEPFSTTTDIANLNPGQYCLEIDIGCLGRTSEECFLVLNENCEPNTEDFGVEADILSTCEGESVGEIQLQLNPNFEPYTFDWTTLENETNQNVEGVSAGLHCVSIIGNNGCQVNECFSVESFELPEIIYSNVQHTSDNNQNGGIVSIIIEGDYTSIDWSTGQSNTFMISNLTEGIYCVTINTLNPNCNVTECFNVGNSCDNTMIDANVIHGCEASINLNINSDVNVFWTLDGEDYAGGTFIENLTSGEYCVSIETSSDIICQECFTVNSDAGDQINNISIPCDHSQIIIEVEDFAGPYLIQGTYLSGNTVEFEFTAHSNPIVIENTTLVDAVSFNAINSCGLAFSEFIVFDTDIQVSIPPIPDPYCIADIDPAIIQVEVSGGTLPYSYEWESIIDSEVNSISPGGEFLTVLQEGEYCVTVTDNCGQKGSACVSVDCFDDINDANNPYVCGGFGLRMYRDCPCLTNCGLDFGDDSDIQFDIQGWDQILGTITITWPDGTKTYIHNGSGQQDIAGETEFDIEYEGVYQVTLHFSWLNLTRTCEFPFFKPAERCEPITSTLGIEGAGGIFTGNSEGDFIAGCYRCEFCGLSETQIDLFDFFDANNSSDCETFGYSLIQFVPKDRENPCTGGGQLYFNCPCWDEPAIIEIHANPFSQFIDIKDIFSTEIGANALDESDIPCPGSIGVCIFEHFMVDNLPLIEFEHFQNSVIGFICDEPSEEEDPIEPPDKEYCIGEGNVIFIEDDDPCELTYYCTENPNITHTIGGSADICHFYEYDEEIKDNVCIVVDYCRAEGQCFIISELGVTCEEAFSEPCPCELERGGNIQNVDLTSGYNFLIYPNPTSDRIQIEVNNENIIIENILVLDLAGQDLLKLQNSDKFWDISSLPKGIVLLKINTNYGLFFERIIKL